MFYHDGGASMLCPVCDKEMLIIEFNNVEIDYCAACEGVWLDEGELELLASGGEGASCPFRAALSEVGVGKQGARPCPVCSKKMRCVTLSAGATVEIDKCPRNHGLWCDKGELCQILSHSGVKGAVPDFLRSIFMKSSGSSTPGKNES